jgi:hypothetical protein
MIPRHTLKASEDGFDAEALHGKRNTFESFHDQGAHFTRDIIVDV